MKSKKNGDLGSDEGTQVDLGDDLLSKAAVLNRSDLSSSHQILSTEDALQSVDILMKEELFQEAKKILHIVLRRDPHSIVAKRKLEAIREKELQTLLADRSVGSATPKGPSRVLPTIDAEDILKNLDQDLNLGLLRSPHDLLISLKNPREISSYLRALETQYGDLSTQERLDLGIAFLEMDSYGLAAAFFDSALKMSELIFHDASLRWQAIHLLAEALILDQKAMEAILLLEPVMADSDAVLEIKIHFAYLLGLAHEKTGQKHAAMFWFKKAAQIDPHYRDLPERLEQRG